MYMDGRCLHFEDASFDAIYETTPLEGFGSEEEIAAAAFEMGRVLKPGGIASCTAMFMIVGPPGLGGWSPDVKLVSPEEIQHLIVELSGLELIDSPALEVSEQIRASGAAQTTYADRKRCLGNAFGRTAKATRHTDLQGRVVRRRTAPSTASIAGGRRTHSPVEGVGARYWTRSSIAIRPRLNACRTC